MRHTAVTGQLTFDDCAPDWPAPEPRQRPKGTRYHVPLHSDLRGQNLRSTIRIVTIPITEEYL